jgi:hypothetical protein
MKSENHEICQYVMISYMMAMVKFEKVLNILSNTMFRNRSISQQESYSWAVFNQIWSQSDEVKLWFDY